MSFFLYFHQMHTQNKNVKEEPNILILLAKLKAQSDLGLSGCSENKKETVRKEHKVTAESTAKKKKTNNVLSNSNLFFFFFSVQQWNEQTSNSLWCFPPSNFFFFSPAVSIYVGCFMLVNISIPLQSKQYLKSSFFFLLTR
jgi:hypothetical protein